MLLALAGVTGIGKSYYKDRIVEKLGFEKIKIITTRSIRIGEKNNEDKIFVTPDKLQELRNKNKIAYEFELLGNTYAYSKEELFSNRNTVFELHYDTIYDFKKICPHLCVIYILPKDIEVAKAIEDLRNVYLASQASVQMMADTDALTFSEAEQLNDIITSLERTLPKRSLVHSMTINGEDMSMSVSTVTKEEAAKLMMQLKDNPYISEVKVSGIVEKTDETTNRTEVSFTVNCTLQKYVPVTEETTEGKEE